MTQTTNPFLTEEYTIFHLREIPEIECNDYAIRCKHFVLTFRMSSECTDQDARDFFEKYFLHDFFNSTAWRDLNGDIRALGRPNGQRTPEQLAKKLPGFDQVEFHPVRKNLDTIGHIIQDLNDNYKWTRDAIADWIETLDDVPKFGVPIEEKKPEPPIRILALTPR